MAKTLAEKVWDAHVVRKGDGEGANAQPDLLYIDLHLVHEVTSPQAFEGLRLAGRKLRRPDLTIATEDHNTPTLDIDKPIADLTSRTQIQTLRNNCAGVRCPPAFPRRRRAGDRPRGGPAAGPHPAGHDRGLRRLAHLHARRVRRAGHGHRHVRGRTRHGHPDAVPEAVQDHGHQRRGHAAPRRFRQGHHPGRHRQDRHRRRTGLRAGIPRLRDPGAVHGSPDDHLQHVHRGRSTRRTGCPGPDHLRLHARPPARAAGRRVGRRRRILEHAAHRRRRRRSTSRWTSTPTPWNRS